MALTKWQLITATQRRSVRIAEAKQKGRHTKHEWAALKAFYGFCCLACGWNELEAGGDYSQKKFCLEKDHVFPVSRGGCDCIGNIQPLCNVCNAQKGAGDYVDYRWQRILDWHLLTPLEPDAAGWIDFAVEGLGIEF
jgi:hypothetical protein